MADDSRPREERRLKRLDELTRLQARRSLDPRFPAPEETRCRRYRAGSG